MLIYNQYKPIEKLANPKIKPSLNATICSLLIHNKNKIDKLIGDIKKKLNGANEKGKIEPATKAIIYLY